MERISWVQASRIQAPRRPESKRSRVQPSCRPDSKRPAVQSPNVQTVRPEFSFSDMLDETTLE